MFKKLISIGIIILFLIIGLSGCNDIKDVNQFSITTFKVEPTQINVGEKTNISWEIMNAEIISINNGIGNVSNIGSRIIMPNETTMFTLTAQNENKTITATTEIIVIINSNTSGDNNETEFEIDLEIVNYNIETHKIKFDNTFEKIADGFVYSENAHRYYVNGNVKNNGTENISNAWIIVNFYNKDNFLIYSLSDLFYFIEINEIDDFSVDFTKYDSKDFKDANHVEFVFIKD